MLAVAISSAFVPGACPTVRTERAMVSSGVAVTGTERLATGVEAVADEAMELAAGAATTAAYTIEHDPALAGPRCQRDAERALESVLAAVLIRLAGREATTHAA